MRPESSTRLFPFLALAESYSDAQCINVIRLLCRVFQVHLTDDVNLEEFRVVFGTSLYSEGQRLCRPEYQLRSIHDTITRSRTGASFSTLGPRMRIFSHGVNATSTQLGMAAHVRGMCRAYLLQPNSSCRVTLNIQVLPELFNRKVQSAIRAYLLDSR